MIPKKIGERTLTFEKNIYWRGAAAVAGTKEGKGPLANTFDEVLGDDTLGEKSYEKAEVQLFLRAVNRAVDKSGETMDTVGCFLGGDLLNQIISASFSARMLQLPYIGLYGACSTMTESMMVASMFLDGGFFDTVACATGSHFATAERQYRFPLEMATQRPPTAQWTVTGAGAAVMSTKGGSIRLTQATIGRVVDYGITDANNMGAAMAPAAIDTLTAHFEDTGNKPSDYDLILTGDLGCVGSTIVCEKMREKGYPMKDVHRDAGCMIYSEDQDVHAGGSGCGCIAVVLNGAIHRAMLEKRYRRVLAMATGALLSPTTSLQGESIPGIAHAIVLEV